VPGCFEGARQRRPLTRHVHKGVDDQQTTNACYLQWCYVMASREPLITRFGPAAVKRQAYLCLRRAAVKRTQRTVAILAGECGISISVNMLKVQPTSTGLFRVQLTRKR